MTGKDGMPFVVFASVGFNVVLGGKKKPLKQPKKEAKDMDEVLRVIKEQKIRFANK